MATTLGLDEAGRGCVIGDLVVGGFLLEDNKLQALMDTGATDSKKLSQRKRERILSQLPAIGICSRRHITPAEIDDGNVICSKSPVLDIVVFGIAFSDSF